MSERPSHATAVSASMPRLKEDLARLVAIPSLSEWGFPEHTRPPLLEAHQAVVELLRDAGVESLSSLELEGTAPVITGEIPAPSGAPTVLLYGHYDVVPAGDETLWTSPPFEATERDGAIYGRGAADSKANILVHVGALRAWEGKPPVGIKLLIEGQEEVGSPLEDIAFDREYDNRQPDMATALAAQRIFAREQVPEDMVGALLFLLGRGSDFVTGQNISVNGGRVFN